MTKREAAIVTAYTGVYLCDLLSFYKYAEELMGRPVFTHEPYDLDMWEELKSLSRDDFINLKVTDDDGDAKSVGELLV
jgi:hypothetical protein